MNSILLLLLIGLGIFIIHKIKSKFKVPLVGSLAVVNGGVKCGKSTLGLSIAISNYKKVHRKWKFRKFFAKMFSREFLVEEPLFYSNIPVSFDYVEITDDLINRVTRFAFGSVVYFDEANLLADSMSALRDKSLNERVAIFNALIGHETHGGLLVYTAHNLERLHYGIRDICGQYFYVHRCVKWLPFFVICHVRERVVGNDVVNVESGDVADSLLKVVLPKSIWKKFDAFAYSVLTDDLPVEKTIVHGNLLSDLKVRRFLSFKKWEDEGLKNFFTNRSVNDEKKNN